MKKITAKKENCVWFYCEGSRWGRIVKRYSKSRMAVRDCSGKRYIIRLNEKGKWKALTKVEIEVHKNLKGKKNGKKKIKIKKARGKKRIKIKIKRRKIRKSRKNTKDA